METILNVRNLNVYYKNKETLLNRFCGKSKDNLQHVLKNVSFDMKKGEVLGLVGESGCGKTSLAKAILGMQKQYDGMIALDCPNPVKRTLSNRTFRWPAPARCNCGSTFVRHKFSDCGRASICTGCNHTSADY